MCNIKKLKRFIFFHTINRHICRLVSFKLIVKLKIMTSFGLNFKIEGEDHVSEALSVLWEVEHAKFILTG